MKAMPMLTPMFTPMRSTLVVAAVLAALWSVPPVFAQRPYDIMVEEPGRRAQKPRKTERPAVEQRAPDETKPPKKTAKPVPRGGGYVPNMTLPRSEPVRVPPTVDVYRPPPINSFSDRVRNCIHSYPLNAGIGNNPTDQSSYIRQCAN